MMNGQKNIKRRNYVFADSETAKHFQIMSTKGWTVCRWHDSGHYSDLD